MIEKILNGRADEGMWVLPEIDVRVEASQPNNLTRDVRIPESIAYARKIQYDCIKELRRILK